MTEIINPILSGFYPDPTICEANNKFYIVNSSFAYFPGLPIFESDDLCNWKQIGNIIANQKQMTFCNDGISRGLFAPTLRYHNKKFYCICTNVDNGGNFFVTADKPEGPWSNPIWIKNAQGIDPSLFFDDDGTVWYIGTRPNHNGPVRNGDWEIWIQKINIKTGELIGESKSIWNGALRNCIWPEGPHIYKINNKYYLLHAEGGTGPDHAVCIARCNTIDGEWEGKASNPILTHRHLGKTAGIIYVGHGDLVYNDKNNTWWMVCLASRPYGKQNARYCNMGRETFLVPVKWEDEWPVVSWETGLIEQSYYLDGRINKGKVEKEPLFTDYDNFDEDTLRDYWVSIGVIDSKIINTTDRKGFLRLYSANNINELGERSILLRRQTSFSYIAEASIDFDFRNDNDRGGLICFQNEFYNYKMQVIRKNSQNFVQLIKNEKNCSEVVIEDKIEDKSQLSIKLKVIAEKQNIRFYYSLNEKETLLCDNIDGSILSIEKAGGFVGSLIGVYCESDKKDFFIDVDWFKYNDVSKDWINHG
ncbi:MAG: glycoside hydrolase family 43 protein [Treponema sp.]|jgi:xylan 1,4-beta-xylosidase|nr:glycoside hydrolase family 43 protein [Treponema sp.]